MKEYVKMFKNAFDYKGRTRRREYWVPQLLNSSISCFGFGIVFLLATIAGDCLWYRTGDSFGYSTSGSAIATIAFIPYILISVFITIVSISLAVRRLHDAGFAAWVYPVCLIGCCCCGIGAIALFVLSCFDSKPDNQWGPNPKYANPNEYTGVGSIVLAVVLYIIAIIFQVVCMVSNMFIDPMLFY